MSVVSRNIVGIEAQVESDSITRLSCSYRQQNVYSYFRAKGFKVWECFEENARRHPVRTATETSKNSYVTGSSHGKSDEFTGNDPNSIVYGYKMSEYGTRKPNFIPREVKGKIAHFLSCLTALELGPEFVRWGCRAYFGYNAPFVFVCDETVDEALACDAEIDYSFADGLNAQQVHGQTIAMYNTAINALLAKGHFLQAACLEHNRDALSSPVTDSIYGDKDASLESKDSKPEALPS